MNIYFIIPILVHFIFVLLKVYDMVIIGVFYNIKHGKKLSDRFHKILTKDGIYKANRFLSLSNYNPMKFYQSITKNIKTTCIKKFFKIYYKWPVITFLTSLYLILSSECNTPLLIEIILIISALLLILSSALHEVSARLMLGSIDNMRQYTYVDINEAKNRENISWNTTRLLRDFFLTLSVQLFCFCFVFSALYRSVSKFEIGKIDGKELDILDSIYFSITTLTTTGYGDLSPTGWLSKTLSMSEMIVIYLFVILLSGHFALSLTESLTASSNKANAAERKKRAPAEKRRYPQKNKYES
jgi:hypothetical protein